MIAFSFTWFDNLQICKSGFLHVFDRIFKLREIWHKLIFLLDLFYKEQSVNKHTEIQILPSDKSDSFLMTFVF